MGRRGPRSAHELALGVNVDGSPPKLTAPTGLSIKERVVFEAIIASCDARHFQESDVPLLVSYTQATLLAHKLGRTPSRIREWEVACRTALALARSLRLCPHSRTDPKVIARMRPQGPMPWDDEGGPWSTKYDATSDDEDDEKNGKLQ
jgi:hypothetical protein